MEEHGSGPASAAALPATDERASLSINLRNANAAGKSKKQVELESVSDALITYADMDHLRKATAIEVAKLAFLSLKKGELVHWKDVAEMIKKDFEARCGGTWHCVVGTHFGSFVSFEKSCVIHFWIAEMGVLLFKHG